MTKTSRTAFLWFRSDNRKPVLSLVEGSAIQNPKWLRLSIITFVLVLAGTAVQAQQAGKIPRIGFVVGTGPEGPNIPPFRQGSVNALITITGALMLGYTKRIADLAIKSRLPSMYERSNYVEAGGLIS